MIIIGIIIIINLLNINPLFTARKNYLFYELVRAKEKDHGHEREY